MSIQSLRTGVSGLNANQTRLDTISNNISNSSTVAFKKGRVAFSEVMGQEIVGVSSTAGGSNINPSQVGRGVSVGSVDRNFSQGSLDQTGIKTDLALSGDGFFVASPKEGSGSQQRRLTRAGNFTFNQNGEFVTANGLNVQGWEADENGKINTGELKNIQFDPNAQSAAKFTSEAGIGGNLSADAQVGDTSSISSVVFDEQGTSYDAVVDFQKKGDNSWDFSVGSANATSGEGTNPFDTSAPEVLLDNNGEVITEDDLSSAPNNGNILTTANTKAVEEDSNVEVGDTVAYEDISASALDGSPPPSKEEVYLRSDGKIAASGGSPITVTDDATSLTESSESLDTDSVQVWTDDAGNKVTDGKGNFITVEDEHDSSNLPGSTDPADYGTETISEGFLNKDDQVITDDSGNVITDRENLPSGVDATAIDNPPAFEGSITFSEDGSVESIVDRFGGTLENGPTIDWNKDLVEGEKNLSLDLTGLTQFSGSTTSKFQSQNGNSAGELSDFSITPEGELQLNFTNGEQRKIFQLAIGDVNNPNGLKQQGDNFFTTTSASGDLKLGRAGRDLRTSVQAGALESSNVDLADEFANLIEAQRSYQASSRVVTTADQVLQETVQLKR